jgi:predicted phosphodiesterase
VRIAVISDIHGNFDALEAVLKDIDQNAVEQIYCLGDFVDYGPESERVRILVQTLKFPTVMGNHECALIDDAVLAYFARVAYQSTLITRQRVSSETIAFIHTLPLYLTYENLRFVHGTPPDSPYDYIFDLTLGEMIDAFNATPERVIFVGHTHLLGMFEFDGEKLFTKGLSAGKYRLRPDWRYIINAGSVGQPREVNKAAKYVIFDTTNLELEVRFVRYDPRRTAQLILDLGFPTECATRILPIEDTEMLTSQ